MKTNYATLAQKSVFIQTRASHWSWQPPTPTASLRWHRHRQVEPQPTDTDGMSERAKALIQRIDAKRHARWKAVMK